MAPDGARIIFFLLIQTLPTSWAERILISRFYIFGIFLDPKFPDFQVPDFQISRNLAWARLGPWAGPGWAGLVPWAGWAPCSGKFMSAKDVTSLHVRHDAQLQTII